MNESQAIESNATQLVCAQCGSRLSSTDGADKVCINCLLRVVLDQDDVEPFKPGSGEVSTKSPWRSDQSIAGDSSAVARAAPEHREAARRRQMAHRSSSVTTNYSKKLAGVARVWFTVPVRKSQSHSRAKDHCVGPLGEQSARETFPPEAEAAASLDYAGIVPIHEVGERDGSCYFSMKFVEGGQLDEVVRRSPISIRQAVELIA